MLEMCTLASLCGLGLAMLTSTLKANLPSMAQLPFMQSGQPWRQCLPWQSFTVSITTIVLVSLPVVLASSPLALHIAASNALAP
jgi:hypothetical protein